ncbi:MAG: hypothetical protein B6244_10330 [Candidatus Cloacimonetes bacterium 4572_55]|nr:MAG: hypothetical protein B6244_10330 [Candidatus Cloacimonetes bacterium 4572_55]
MSRKLLFILLTIFFVFTAFQIQAQIFTTEEFQEHVRTFVDDTGMEIVEITVPGRPPVDFRAPVAVAPDPAIRDSNILPSVPIFDWSYGCSSTAAAMMAGYYDLTGFSDIYTGSTNNGVTPLSNSVWGPGECPISATHQGIDGRTTRGHVEDYWIEADNEDPDPYITGGWTEHGYGDCTSDYMGTSQSNLSNLDGWTTFYYALNGEPLHNYIAPPGRQDGCHGLHQFFESFGYQVNQSYNQYIVEAHSNGFTYDDFVSQIDAGHPVLIHVEGHTMLGVGYEDSLIYIHDTWDHELHSMEWGGVYVDMQHYGVTVIELEPVQELCEYAAEFVGQAPNPDPVFPGFDYEWWVEFRNTGSETWTRDSGPDIYLATGSHSNPDQLYDIIYLDWVSDYRPTGMDQESAAPGETARFTFTFHVPGDAQMGWSQEYLFSPMVENVSWFDACDTPPVSAALRFLVDQRPDPAACYAYAIHDEGVNDTQIFTIDINNGNAIAPLGEMHEDYDVEGIEIHPATGIVYATAGSHNEHGMDGYLFVVDANTGDLTPVGYSGFTEIVALTFRPSDNTLWGWSEGSGLLMIDLITGAATLEYSSNRNIEGLAWDNDGLTLYATANTRLWAYNPDPAVNDMTLIADNLPGETEALEMRRDGRLMGSINEEYWIVIFSYDLASLSIITEEEIPTPYHDIESISFPDWCDVDIGETTAQCLAYAVHDEGLNHSQLFTIDLNNENEVSPLGEIYMDYDIEGIEIHPVTHKLYATAGSDNFHGYNGYLFTFDGFNGELTAIGYTGFDEIVGLGFRPSDNSLWGWSENVGLIQINVQTGAATLEYSSSRNIEGMAWNAEGSILYCATGNRLFAYNVAGGSLTQIAENLPGTTEALEMRRDGYLMGSTHQTENVTIFAYDVENLQVVAEEEIETPYYDIESIAWPDWCDWNLRTRCIDIHAGRYNYVSFGWELAIPAIENVFQPIEENLEIVVTNEGGVYIPGTINTIGNAEPGYVYRVFANGEAGDIYDLCVIADSLTSSEAIVLRPTQWNWVSSTCPESIPIESFFADIMDDVTIVTDDNNGLIYIPGLVNTIGFVLPHVGYRVYTSLDNVTTYEYDCENGAAPAAMANWTRPERPTQFDYTQTGESYAVVIRDARVDGERIPIGSEIAVYDRSLCVGATVVQGYPVTIPVWESISDKDLPGFTSGNNMSFKVWSNGREIEIDADYEQGSGLFGDGLYSVVTLGEKAFLQESGVELEQNRPNPFNPQTAISFNLSYSAHVSLKVYNINGQLVRALADTEFPAGSHQVNWSGENDLGQTVGSGLYFYRLHTQDGSFDQTRKMILMK